MNTIKTFTAAAILAASFAAPAKADIKWNGLSLNGIQFNGVQFNGPLLQGTNLQGIQWNGMKLNGPILQGIHLNGATEAAHVGQPVAVTLANGRTIELAH